MSTFTRPGTSLPLLFAVVISATVAACSGESTSTKGTDTSPTSPADAATPVTPSKTPPLSTTIDPKVASTLQGAGIDVNNPGDLETLLRSQSKLKAVMASFTIALGTNCAGCHAGSGTALDFKAETPNKKIAKSMWNDYVAKLQKKEGGAIYCDSCHQGKLEFLDRADDRSLAAWMKENLVDKLSRKDGAAHACATCHGEPFKGGILEAFGK